MAPITSHKVCFSLLAVMALEQGSVALAVTYRQCDMGYVSSDF